MYIITKNDIFIWKGHDDDMFNLNIEVNKMSHSIYICDFNILYSRLCHVNKHVMSNFSSSGLISKLSLNDFERCKFYSQGKIIKCSRISIIREYEPVDLIFYDICKLDGSLTRNLKKYNLSYLLMNIMNILLSIL